MDATHSINWILSVFGQINPEIVVRLVAQVILLSMSAFYSASEVALFSLSRLDLRKLRAARHPAAEPLQNMVQEPRNLIISILCGNETVNIMSSANMAAILLMFFTEEETRWVNLFVMVPMLLLFGEVTPKTYAVTFPVQFASKVTYRFLPRWIAIIAPVRRAVRVVSDRITTFVVGAPVTKENILYTDEFRTLVEEGEAAGALDPRERELIDNMLEASETEVIQIMTPITRLHFLDGDKPLPQVLEDFRRYRHPHMPVKINDRTRIAGFLEAEDVQHLLTRHSDLGQVRLQDLLRPAHFVSPGKKVDEMFDYFNQNNTWAAIVVGDYGDVYGIVTIADVLSFVFGGLTKKIESLGFHREPGEGEWEVFTVSGDMNLELFNELTHIGLDDEDDPMVATLGGFAFLHFDRLPEVDDEVIEDGVYFKVVEMDNLRIKTLKVWRFEASNRKQTSNGEVDEPSEEDNAHDVTLSPPQAGSAATTPSSHAAGE